MAGVFEELQERGLVQQVTHEEPLRQILKNEEIPFYVGFDPTADSLHVGHLMPIIGMMRLQQAGHRPIAVVGGGTAMIGDPSGKTEMRRMLSKEQIEANKRKIRGQLERFLDFGCGRALMVDNAEWLMPLNYIEFLREIGAHFSVNRMLTAECFRTRLERGLSFIEFNYMLLQSYDFLVLYQKYGCRLQMGGDDQWSNILAGVDLIRRVTGGEAYGLTFPLLTTSTGRKMGKTESGAVWLDAERTTPFDFYQYWRNMPDDDIPCLLSLYTFLPMDEVRRLSSLEGKEINEAKKILAYEVTKLVHGSDEAEKAQRAAQALFEEKSVEADEAAIPSTTLSQEELDGGIEIIGLFVRTGLCPSRSAAKRLVKQGGAYVNDERVDDFNAQVSLDDFKDGLLELRKGKKTYHHVRLE